MFDGVSRRYDLTNTVLSAGLDRRWRNTAEAKQIFRQYFEAFVATRTRQELLQESLKRDLQDQLMRDGEKGKLPVIYVFLFDKDTAYGARGTPAVNEKALQGVNLVEKTANGPASAPITIEDRAFGWAAQRVPKLGADVGIVVVRSEI